MKLSDYLNQLERGGKAAFARKIGAHTPDLSDWIAGKRPIPIKYCIPIERETEGYVTRADCRPSDWQAYWPDFSSSESTNSTTPSTQEA